MTHVGAAPVAAASATNDTVTALLNLLLVIPIRPGSEDPRPHEPSPQD
jgi:hypothetical protein